MNIVKVEKGVVVNCAVWDPSFVVHNIVEKEETVKVPSPVKAEMGTGKRGGKKGDVDAEKEIEVVVKTSVPEAVEQHMPEGYIEASDEVAIGWKYSGGEFIAPDRPEKHSISLEEIKRLRAIAYADPSTGSDKLFSKYTRLQASGASDKELKAALKAAEKRRLEIQKELPID